MALPPGVYPAAVTPFTHDDKIDEVSLAKLLAKFEAEGCQGVLLAGTNGEGPSLSAVEKRDLARTSASLKGKLKVVIGIATPSLDEAKWLARQAGKAGVDAILVMPPAYFRSASVEGIVAWFHEVADASAVPVLVYNFPRMTGISFSSATMGVLMAHSNILGLKDSSGDPSNLAAFREVVPSDKVLFVGDETLLLPALENGWTGTISGAANLIAPWLVRTVAEPESRATLADLVAPVLAAIRSATQPATNKAALHALGVLASPGPRLPLETVDAGPVIATMRERLGIAPSGT